MNAPRIRRAIRPVIKSAESQPAEAAVARVPRRAIPASDTTQPVAAPRAPRRIVPIKAVPAPQPAPQPVTRHDDEKRSGPKVDYAAVIARYANNVNNRASAIRAKCVECSCGVLSEVKNCAVTKCALWPFREGADPFRKKRSDGFGSKKTNESEDEE